jgi:GTPase SAR1 family protein
MQEQGQVFDISSNTWKVGFSVSKQINEPVEGEEVEPVFEQAKIQVEILKVPGQDKYCVDFQRKAGSAILFYDNANKYIDLLELCNNATLDSEAEASTQSEPMAIDVGGAAQQ